MISVSGSRLAFGEHDTVTAGPLFLFRQRLGALGGAMCDADYKFAPLELTRPYLGESRVHNGFFSMFKALLCEITEEVERVRPRVITVTGHSLGGAVASLLALHLQKRFLVPTEAVLFGAPSAGDENFVRDLSSSVQVRHILYVGRGWDADEGRKRFTLGDLVVQFGCAAMPGCPNMDAGAESDEFQVRLILCSDNGPDIASVIWSLTRLFVCRVLSRPGVNST